MARSGAASSLLHPIVPMPRLLFVAHNVPYPPDRGYAIRTYHFLKSLAQRYQVEALLFQRPHDPTALALEERVRHLRDMAEVRLLSAPYDRGPLSKLTTHVRSVAGGAPYIQRAFDGPAARHVLGEALGRSPDVVHLDSEVLGSFADQLGELPLGVSHHNVESSLLRRRALRSGPVVRRYARLQAARVLAAERRLTRRADLNLVTSARDAKLFRRLGCEGPFDVIPNAVDTEGLRPRYDGDRGLVFVGGFDWFPNRDAFDFFVDDILPRLRELHSGGNRQGRVDPIRWIGKAEGMDRARILGEYGVEITGYVDDLVSLVQEAACYVVPLRVGGGTRLKILEAWALGKAVVSTRIGCQGLAAKDGENILVRDDPEAFARAVHELLDDPAARERLGRNARRTVEQEYSWASVGRKLVGAYEALG